MCIYILVRCVISLQVKTIKNGYYLRVIHILAQKYEVNAIIYE